MIGNPLVSFHVINDVIIRLIAHKRKNKQDIEADELQNAFQCTESLIQRMSEEMHILKLERATEFMKAKMLEKELKYVYNELYRKNATLATELISKSHIPTKKELEQEVIVK